MGRWKSDLPKPPRDRRRVGLSPFKENALKERLRKCTPSEPWVEEQIVTVFKVDASGKRVPCRYHDKKVFPPGGMETLMICCPRCEVFNPPNAMEHGKCLDHAKHNGWGPSPSALAIRRMDRHRITEEHFLMMEPEDEESLLREIEVWKLQQAETGKSGTVL
jgi:hypothetical protein